MQTIDKKIEIIYIATNGYIKYLDNFMESLRHFVPGVKKYVRILTNEENVECNRYDNQDIEDVEFIHIFDLFYPCINLNKTMYIKQLKPTDADYIFYFDADTIFKEVKDYNWEGLFETLDADFFCMTVHPHYNLTEEATNRDELIDGLFTYNSEHDPTQVSYIPTDNFYFPISSMFFAKRDIMYKMCDHINDMITTNMTRDNSYKIPRYIDENYFTRVVYEAFNGINNDINIKIGNYCILYSVYSIDNLPETFVYQKNMGFDFKTRRR